MRGCEIVGMDAGEEEGQSEICNALLGCNVSCLAL